MQYKATLNQTNYTFNSSVWIGNTSVIGVLIIISVYLAIALVYYQIKKQKCKKGKFTSLSPEVKITLITKYLCTFVAGISILNHLSTFGTLWIEVEAVAYHDRFEELNTVEVACHIITKMEITTVTLGTGFVHLFLWFRQRIFYTHPSLKGLNDKILVRIMSLAIIGVWLIVYVIGLVSYYVLIQYEFDPYAGCLVKESSDNIYIALIISWTSLSSFMQVTLLGLFIFPIVNQNQHLIHKKSLVRRVKKAFALTAVCLASDISASVLSILLNAREANTFVVAYNINLVINLFVMILCFDNWKTMLWPWRRRSQKPIANIESTQT